MKSDFVKDDAQAHEKLFTTFMIVTVREELFVSLMKQPQGVKQHLWCVKPFNLETSPQG